MKFGVACTTSLAVASLAIAASAEKPAGLAGYSLAELMEGMASTSGVIADFREERRIALLEKPLVSSGRLYFVPPDRMVRFTLEPERSALIVDGERLRLRLGDGEQFDLSRNPMARIFVDNFIVLVNGDLPRLEDLYRTDFRVEAQKWTLLLVPRRPPLRGAVREIALRGDREGIREMVVRNSDGDQTSTALDIISNDYRFTDDQLEDLFVEGTLPVTTIAR